MHAEVRHELCVVIVNYKTPLLVIDCLNSLIPEVQGTNYKVVVIDNNSQDNSISLLNEWIESHRMQDYFRLVSSDINTGFSGGNNFGINAINAETYILLNSDTKVKQGALRILLETARNYGDVGIIGPRLEYENTTPQKSCFKFHTPISEFARASGIGVIAKMLNKYTVARPVSDSKNFYDWISFACVLIKREVVENIGLLDDKFFMYYEDVEFCYRARKIGWKILYQPDARVIHLRGGSSPLKLNKRIRKRLPRYYYESRTRYFYLLYGWSGLFGANLAWLLGNSICEMRAFLTPSHNSYAAKYQWKDIWINFTNPLAQYIHPNDYD